MGHLEGKITCTYFLQWFCLPKSHSTYHVCKVLVCSINWCWYSKKPWHTLYSCVFFSSNLTAYPWFRARNTSSSRRHCTAGSAVLTEWLKGWTKWMQQTATWAAVQQVGNEFPSNISIKLIQKTAIFCYQSALNIPMCSVDHLQVQVQVQKCFCTWVKFKLQGAQPAYLLRSQQYNLIQNSGWVQMFDNWAPGEPPTYC